MLVFILFFFSSVFVSRTCLATCCTTGETCVSDIYKKKKHKRIKIFFYAKYRLITYIAGVLRTEPKLHSKQMWIHIEKCENEYNQENNRLIS